MVQVVLEGDGKEVGGDGWMATMSSRPFREDNVLPEKNMFPHLIQLIILLLFIYKCYHTMF